MKSRIQLETEEARSEAWYKMLCEFLFCFVEITNRWSANGRILTLAPALAEITVDAYWPNVATATKAGLRAEFIQNLYVSQSEYADCEALLSTKIFSVQNSVFCKLCNHVAEITNNHFSVGWMLKVVDLLLDIMNETNLAVLVAEASKRS